MPEKFDPNKLNTGRPYGVFIEKRRPPFKTYHRLADAVNALMYHGAGTFYEFIDGQWVEKFVYVPPSVCADCGEPFKWNHRYWDPRSPRFEHMKAVCSDCLKFYRKRWDPATKQYEPPLRSWQDLY